MKLADLNELDFNNAGSWPPLAKTVAIALACAVVGAAGYWFDTSHLLENLDTARRTEEQLRQEFAKKQGVLINLDAYRAQLGELEGLLHTMLRQLPTRTEMPDLLEDISNTGRINGLAFELFRPQDERPQDFYAAKPISIRARASYHQFGTFVSSIAALSRIVTVESATVAAAQQQAGRKGGGNTVSPAQELLIEATLQTYRYLDEDAAATPSTTPSAKQQGQRKAKQ